MFENSSEASSFNFGFFVRKSFFFLEAIDVYPIFAIEKRNNKLRS